MDVSGVVKRGGTALLIDHVDEPSSRRLLEDVRAAHWLPSKTLRGQRLRSMPRVLCRSSCSNPRRPCWRPQIAAEARNAAKHAGRQGHCPPETRAADADRAPAGRARRARRRRGSDPGSPVGSEPGAVDTFTRPHMTPVTHVVYAVHYSVHELETSSMPELSRCPWLPTHNLAYVAFEVLPGHAHSGWQRCETWEIAGA